MGTLGNNTSGKIEQKVREELYACGDEMALLKDLLKDPKYREAIAELSLSYSATKLYAKAQELKQDAMEGRIPEDKIAGAQRKIVCYLAAIEGLHVVKSLEKVADEDAYTNEDEDSCSYTM